jgi:prepilin-type N-terminal cleavage/methylation domain-containing protein
MKTRKNNLVSGFTLVEVIIALVVVAIVAAMMATYFGTSITQSSAPIFGLKAAGNLNQIMEKITTDYNNTPPTWSPNTLYAANTIILPTEGKRNGRQYITILGGTSGSTEPATWPPPGGNDGGVTWTYSGTTPPKNWFASTAYTVNSVVYPTNGYQYICTIAGPSNPTHVPNWSTAVEVGDLVTASGWTWKCRGPQPTLALQTKIAGGVVSGQDHTQTFGVDSVSYRLIQNSFIRFVLSGSNYVEDTVTGALAPGHADYGKYLKVTIGLPLNAAPRTDETLTILFVRR